MTETLTSEEIRNISFSKDEIKNIESFYGSSYCDVVLCLSSFGSTIFDIDSLTIEMFEKWKSQDNH